MRSITREIFRNIDGADDSRHFAGTGGDDVTGSTYDDGIQLNPVSISFGEIATYETSMELVTVNDSDADVLIGYHIRRCLLQLFRRLGSDSHVCRR